MKPILRSLFIIIVATLLGLLSSCTKEDAKGPLETPMTFTTAQEAMLLMMRGINLGNTLEPDEEGGWNNGPAQEIYFDDYKQAGFKCVRIPVKWGSHTLESPPYTIDPLWMQRIETIVDWGLERNLFIVLNAHHEDWLKQDYSEFNKARFDSIWAQISQRFKDRSERLLFEIINEPFGMTAEDVDDLNFRILPLIREHNPTRIVIFSGNEWSGLNQMMAAAIPDDDYLMAYFHSYDPWDFAGEGNGTWGTQTDRNGIASMFQQAADWSAAHQIPVMVSEFGAVHACDYNSRMRHYATYVEEALRNNVAFQAWDDGGNFGIYERNDRSWPEVKDILIHGHPDGPTDLALETVSESSIRFSWVNRSPNYDNIIIQRRTDEGAFEQLTELTSESTDYVDVTAEQGHYYYYRVLAALDESTTYYSYPIRTIHGVSNANRGPYHGAAIAIPGTIQAEDFDLGGEGVAYHDSDPANIPNAYRPVEGVDIQARDAGGYQIAYLESGEWLEYTIQVPESRVYTMTTFMASMEGGGKLRYVANGSPSPEVTVPATNSWQTLTTVATTLPLVEGEQVVRLEIVSAQPYNIDRFVFE